VRVRLQWLDGGAVALDSGDKPAFTPLEDVPGLYRLILTEGAEGQRAWIYIGETDNLRRRLAGNCRNPGPPRAPSGAANSRRVLHPSRHLPMDAERRAPCPAVRPEVTDRVLCQVHGTRLDQHGDNGRPGGKEPGQSAAMWGGVLAAARPRRAGWVSGQAEVTCS